MLAFPFELYKQAISILPFSFFRYFLGEEATVSGFSLFGGNKSPTLSVKPGTKKSGADKATIQAEAQRKAREEEQALARKKEEEKQKEIEAARKQKEQQALARKQAEDAKQKRENQQKVAADEVTRQRVEAKKQAEKIVSTSPRGVTISLFGFGQKKDEMSSSSGPKSAPSVPTISKWRQESDGSISGFISGSNTYKNGEPITTSPIRGKAVGGRAVTTKSGSK